MNFSEKELEDILFKKLNDGDYDSLYKRGFTYYDPEEDRDVTFVDRQVNLMPYGIADIIVTNTYHDYVGHPDGDSFEYRLVIDIIELKVEPIRSKDINQALRYKRAIERYHQHKCENDNNKFSFDIDINIILIGSGINHGHYIFDEVEYGGQFYIYTYEFNPIDGITFNSVGSGWHIEENEKQIKSMDSSLMICECANYFNLKSENENG
jgi:hypothetical protein